MIFSVVVGRSLSNIYLIPNRREKFANFAAKRRHGYWEKLNSFQGPIDVCIANVNRNFCTTHFGMFKLFLEMLSVFSQPFYFAFDCSFRDSLAFESSFLSLSPTIYLHLIHPANWFRISPTIRTELFIERVGDFQLKNDQVWTGNCSHASSHAMCQRWLSC